MKKSYVKPTILVVELKRRSYLLSGSLYNDQKSPIEKKDDTLQEGDYIY